MTYKAGDRVRLRGDPGRVGVITGLTRPRLQLTYYQVSFPDGSNYVPEDQLEPLTEGGNDPITDLEQGRLASCADLRRALVHFRLTGRLADIIYSMEATETPFSPYPVNPVLKLPQPSG